MKKIDIGDLSPYCKTDDAILFLGDSCQKKQSTENHLCIIIEELEEKKLLFLQVKVEH